MKKPLRSILKGLGLGRYALGGQDRSTGLGMALWGVLWGGYGLFGRRAEQALEPTAIAVAQRCGFGRRFKARASFGCE